jgi:hypothetical protein
MYPERPLGRLGAILAPGARRSGRSLSGAVMYLGRQLGRRGPRDTPLGSTFEADRQRVLGALRGRFDFEHGDSALQL